MTTSRQKVLNHLKKIRSASAREIARALKMSAPNVRHHLSVLCSDGCVEMTESRPRGGRGRPENMYSLAQSVLGDNLSVLVDALLSEGVDAKRIGKRIAETKGLSELAKQPVAKRLHLLVEKLNDMHYRAHWEAGAEGPRMIFGQCPYSKVIAARPELCKMDAAMLEDALGSPVSKVMKSKAGTHGLCPFIFIVR